MRPQNTLFAIAVALALSACGGSGGETGPHFLYSSDPMSAENPFPDARLLAPEALPSGGDELFRGVHLRPEYWAPFLPVKAQTKAMKTLLRNYALAAEHLDAVGTFGSTFLPISEDVEIESVRGNVARLVWTGEKYEVLEADVHVQHSHEALREGASTEGVPTYVMVYPRVRLPESARGLLVIKRGVKTKDGREFVVSSALRDSAEGRAWREGAALALGIAPEDVLFTVPQIAGRSRSVFGELLAWSRESQVPAFEVPAKAIITDAAGERPVGVWRAEEADWNQMEVWLKRKAFSGEAASVGQVVVGSIDTRDLRDANGVWTEAAIADPSTGTKMALNFVLSLPKGAKPAGGWPVVIGGPGVGGRNSLKKNDGESYCLMWAELLAQRGLGCFGIDFAEHGHRGNPISNFFTIPQLIRIRERFRQTVFDLMQATRTIPVIDIDGDGSPDLSEDIGYFGHSLGGIIGSAFVSSDPRVRYSVLGAPGGGLANILTSPDIGGKLGLIIASEAALTFDSPEYQASFPMIRLLGQLFLEGGDPVNLAGVADENASLIIEQVSDLTVPNSTCKDLGLALGFPVVEAPISGSTPLHAYYIADSADYIAPSRLPNYNAHDLIFAGSATPLRNLIQNFLGTRGTTLSLD